LKYIAEVPSIGMTIAQVVLTNLQKERRPSFDASTGEILEGS
jgi:hypothetical protein